jgi:hypothetical protein
MARVVHEYAIPESLRQGSEGLPSKVGLRELTSREEIDANKVGGLDFMRTQYEAVKRAICELDGKKVSIADVELDKFWDAAGPRLRALLIKTYNRMSSATEEEDRAFFESEQVKAG